MKYVLKKNHYSQYTQKYSRKNTGAIKSGTKLALYLRLGTSSILLKQAYLFPLRIRYY